MEYTRHLGTLKSRSTTHFNGLHLVIKTFSQRPVRSLLKFPLSGEFLETRMPRPFLDALPPSGLAVLRNARIPAAFLTGGVPEGLPVDADNAVLIDLRLVDGRIAGIGSITAEASGEATAIDLQGRHVWPLLVDVHAHLDKGHIGHRTRNVDGTFMGARDATATDRAAYWDHADLVRRMTFGLQCAESHGVTAIRTHIDSHEGQGATSWKAYREVRDAWAGRITLQAAGLLPLDAYRTPYGAEIADIVALSEGVIGGVTRADLGSHDEGVADLDDLLDRLFTLARERDLDIDLHVDESSHSNALGRVAAATLRHGYEGRVTCGHCCSLALMPPEAAQAVIGQLAKAGISLVTLPTVNMYLQDREAGRTPRWRGVTPVQELRAAGVRVAVAGDNCRDPFHAYGDHDMLDTFRQGVRILHLDHPFGDAPALVGPVPAAIMGLPGVGALTVNGPADLMILDAWTLEQVIARPHNDRLILRNGQRSIARLPSYAELEAVP